MRRDINLLPDLSSLPMQMLLLVAVLNFIVAISANVLYAQSGDLDFSRDVQPILSTKCFGCHGPDQNTRETDLRLDLKEGLFSDLGELHVVKPNSPEESELYRRIVSTDEDIQMPPVGSENQLSNEEVATIKQWIEQGAPWQKHWAFVAVQRPMLPKVEVEQWVQTAIDRFVLAQLESRNLKPSPVADRRTLIRRVTFDLTGLPPGVEEVRDFVADQTADAYEKVVDQLLASPHYGEHMARFWLDVARYGDTHGLHVDNYREMWPYRDWVIKAFNANMGYDQFLIEQLAGDLLPDATTEQLIASGFNRCHVTTNEGGSIAEEVYVRNVVDRVSTMGTAMLGLTLGCAVCHDHKFDPFTQQDFYQLFAFFNNLDGPEMDGNSKHPAPIIRVPTQEQAKRLAAIETKISYIRQQLQKQCKAGLLDDEREFESYDVREGLMLHLKLDEIDTRQLVNSVDGSLLGKFQGEVKRIAGRAGGALKFGKDGYIDLGNVAELKKNKEFSFGAWVRPEGSLTGTVLAKTNMKDLEKGYTLSIVDGEVVVDLTGRWPGYSIRVTTLDEVVRPGRWQHLFVTYDGSKFAQGVKVYVDGELRSTKIVCDAIHTEGSIDNRKSLLLGRRDTVRPFAGGSLDDVRIYERRLMEAEVRAVYQYSQLEPILEKSRDTWEKRQQDLYRELVALRTDKECQEKAKQLDALQQQYDNELLKVATTAIYRERKKQRPAYLLVRGEYGQRGQQVERRTPVSLPAFDDSFPRNRLGLAHWLLSEDQPLTGRVAVNRFWQQFFGVGLVETSEDFGTQGTLPSHPELLDWLTVEFRESGWNVKALVKQIVMSETYRQRSSVSADLVAKDPSNRWLARGPRYRLDAEMLRDQALVVSGLLYDQVGGPSVKPPQPDGLWRAVGLSDSDTVEFVQDRGSEKVHRRSLYTFWKRTSPPPQMSIFDAPSRESCIMRRERTNTPLQALLLMNDPQYVEAARHFAERVLREAESDSENRIRWAFEQVTLRQPQVEELEELLGALRDFRINYQNEIGLAEELISVGEVRANDEFEPRDLATWTMMGNLLLNLDEVVTKE